MRISYECRTTFTTLTLCESFVNLVRISVNLYRVRLNNTEYVETGG